MLLTLTNNGDHPVPIMSADEGGWAESLDPGQSWALSHTDSSVVIIGNKPSVTEQIQQGISTLAKTVQKLVAVWQANNNLKSQPADAVVRVAIQNTGDKSVRVILGDGVHDYTLAPNETYNAEAWGYLELRELGDVEQDPNQHEAP